MPTARAVTIALVRGACSLGGALIAGPAGALAGNLAGRALGKLSAEDKELGVDLLEGEIGAVNNILAELAADQLRVILGKEKPLAAYSPVAAQVREALRKALDAVRKEGATTTGVHTFC